MESLLRRLDPFKVKARLEAVFPFEPWASVLGWNPGFSTTALIEAGLNPQLGLLHRPSGNHDALASDLQEELRHQVDALVWTLIKRRQVKPEDFVESKNGGGVWMSHGIRKLLIEAFESRLLTEFTPPGQGCKVTYREFLFQQAVQLRHLVLGHIEEYQPLSIAA